jgi:enoyl-CoA hydratase/carnithine racemase
MGERGRVPEARRGAVDLARSPERRNAFDDGPRSRAAWRGGDPAIRAIVLTGAGDRAFAPAGTCGGLDASPFEADPRAARTRVVELFGSSSAARSRPSRA